MLVYIFQPQTAVSVKCFGRCDNNTLEKSDWPVFNGDDVTAISHQGWGTFPNRQGEEKTRWETKSKKSNFFFFFLSKTSSRKELLQSFRHLQQYSFIWFYFGGNADITLRKRAQPQILDPNLQADTYIMFRPCFREVWDNRPLPRSQYELLLSLVLLFSNVGVAF